MRPALVLFAVHVARTSSPARGLMDTVLTAAQRAPLLPIGTKGEQWAACRRWVPWLCAYTGARVGELTQLRAGDVQARQGPAGSIWVLRLTPDAGTIKTDRARTVPLHADLVHQGFPEFAACIGRVGPRCAAFLQAAPRAEPQPQLPRA